VAATASGEWLACSCGAPACSLLQRLRPRATYCLLHQSSISESSLCAWLFHFLSARADRLAQLLVWMRVFAQETDPRDISLYSLRPCNDQSGVVITMRSHRLSSTGAGRFCICVSARVCHEWMFASISTLRAGPGLRSFKFWDGKVGPCFWKARGSRMPIRPLSRKSHRVAYASFFHLAVKPCFLFGYSRRTSPFHRLQSTLVI
jgi:hypothetical protein